MKTIVETLSYAKPQQVAAEGCLAITFKRKAGTNPVSVNSYPLDEDEEFSIEQNVGDEDWTNYRIVFYAGTGDNEIWVFKTKPL